MEIKVQFRWLLASILLVLSAFLGLSPRPHSVRLEMQRAQTAAEAEAWQPASHHTAAAAEQLPWRADLWALAGRYAFQGEDYQAAIEYLIRAADSSASGTIPLPADAWLLLGDAYRQMGELPAAQAAWQEALKVSSAPRPLWERLLEAQLSLGNYPSAIELLQQMSASQPEDASLHFKLGLLLASQEPEAALEPLNQAASQDPAYQTPVTLLRRSIMSGRIGEDPAYSLLSSGRALAQLEQWPFAAEAFRQATLARPDYAEAWAYLGEALQHLPASQAAIDQTNPSDPNAYQALHKALELEPNSVAANSLMALYWSRQRQTDNALQSMRRAVELEPDSPELNAQLGSMLAQSGDYPAAYFAYQRAVDLSPLEPKFHRLLAEFTIMYNYQIVERGLPAARQAVILAPEDAASLDTMAQVFIALGDLSSAERFLNQAVQADRDYPPAYLHLGALYLLRSEWEKGRMALERAFALEPAGATADQARRLMETYFP
jgi:tetratricopeptide (TPR) repeat protein